MGRRWEWGRVWNAPPLFHSEHQSREPPRAEGFLSGAQGEQGSEEWGCLAWARLWLTPTVLTSLLSQGLTGQRCALRFISPDPTVCRLHCTEVASPVPQGRWDKDRAWLWATPGSAHPPSLSLRVIVPVFPFSPQKALLAKHRVWEHHRANQAPSQTHLTREGVPDARSGCWSAILCGDCVAGPTFEAQIQILIVERGFRDPLCFPRKGSTL